MPTLIFCIALAAATFAAQSLPNPTPSDQTWQEGVDYVRTGPPTAAAERDGPIKVVEFFSYECPHCDAFEPYVAAWLKTKPADVQFERVPLAWDRPERLALARLYFALERLHRLDLHDRVFDALHRQNNHLFVPGDEAATLQVQQAFAQAHGIAPREFEAAWRNATDAIERANRRALALHIPWVPSVVIDDTYVTDLGKAQGPARLITLLDDLIERERRARRASHAGASPGH